VLFYLTNSKPFTQSGYTERSHHILTSLKSRGINVLGVTRIGYPIVIGNFALESSSSLDDILYRRMLPAVFPMRKSAQISMAVRMLVREARRFDANILHTTTDYKNAIIVSRAAQILGIPWVYEPRGELQKTWLSKRNSELQGLAKYSEYYLAAERKEIEAMENAAAVVQLSEVSKRNSVACGISDNKIAIIPNAVSASEIGRDFNKSSIRNELGIESKHPVIGAITSIVGYEGLDDLIRSIEYLPDVHCIIVGDGEARPDLEAQERQMGLETQIRFVGKQPSDMVWKWYAALDVFVVPRKNQEVCRTVTPIKTLLAQANGVPVVASDLPALREITGNNAVYFPPEQPIQLAKALEMVIGSYPNQIRRQVDRAKMWVRNRSWDANAQRLIALYRQSEDLQ